jgi:hypothetical protein
MMNVNDTKEGDEQQWQLMNKESAVGSMTMAREVSFLMMLFAFTVCRTANAGSLLLSNTPTLL